MAWQTRGASSTEGAAASGATAAGPVASASASVEDGAGGSATERPSRVAGEELVGPEYEPVEGSPHKLAAIAVQTWIYAGPNDETQKLGYLRAGEIVARGEKPVSETKRCPGGWYRVAPRGHVCNGKRASIEADHPVAVATWKKPARGEPLPYRYGRAKEVPPYMYFRVPTAKEQERAELMKLGDRLRTFPKERLERSVGEIEPWPPFLADGKALPKPFGATQPLRVSSHEGKAGAKSAFAFLSIHESGGRLFGLSTNLNLIPIDRVNMVRVTDIHGGPIDDLPAALVLAGGAARHRLDDKGVVLEDGRYERFSAVSLTGTSRGDLWEARDGSWISASQAKLIKKRADFPAFLGTNETSRKWIDVAINDQMLVAYEGQRAVYVTRVSTGRGGMADPEKTTATKRGSFSIKSKHLTATMRGDDTDDYELSDVPYVQYFEEGYALHAAFWHESFGQPYSHGCVNLTPTDAAWIFEWTEPSVPPDWHGVLATGGEGTVVHVRP